MEYSEYKIKMEEDSHKVIEAIANLVNNFSFEPDAFIDQFCREHRTLQQSMFRTIVRLICRMASEAYCTDARNDGSKALAKKFIAGYAEMVKKEEKEHLLRSGYDEATADVKAEEYRVAIVEAPDKYIGLGHV